MKKLVIFVSLVFILSLNLISSVRLPTVGGDDDAWGTVLNEFLNVSHNETGELKSDAVLNFTSNLTMGSLLTFGLLETIDNLVDTWLRINGNLNVTNNLSVGGDVGIGTTPVGGTTKLSVLGDLTLAGTNRMITGNLYYSGGWKYAGNGFGWGFREDNAGLLQLMSAPNNAAGAGATAVVNRETTLAFNLSSGKFGINTSTPLHELTIGTMSANPASLSAIDIIAINTGNNAYGGILMGNGFTNTGSTIRNYHNSSGVSPDPAEYDILSLGSKGWGGDLTTTLNIKLGKVGINTTTPQNTLNVVGDANITGLIYGDGSQLTNLPSSGGVTGLGTYGYIPMWNGTSSLNNSNIFQLGSYVGLGTINPSAQLEINASGDSGIIINSYDSNSPYLLFAKGSSASIDPRWTIATERDTPIWGADADDLVFYDYTGTQGARMTIQNGTGYVGMGTASPTSPLTLNLSSSGSAGGIRVLGYTYPTTDISYWTDGQIALEYNNVYTVGLSANGDSFFKGGELGIGISTPENPLHIRSDTVAQVQIDDTGALGGTRIATGYLSTCNTTPQTIFTFPTRSSGTMYVNSVDSSAGTGAFYQSTSYWSASNDNQNFAATENIGAVNGVTSMAATRNIQVGCSGSGLNEIGWTAIYNQR